MDPQIVMTFAELMTAGGPYVLVAILGWAFWRMNERKDRELKSLHDKFAALAEAQTAAMVKMEAALVGLKDVIGDLRRR